MFHTWPQIPTIWSFPLPGVVWQVQADVDSGELGVLVRVPEDGRQGHVRLAVVDAVHRQGHVLPGAFDWWVGLKALREGMLYLHGYADAGLPVETGIRALDARNGQEIWAQPTLRFHHMAPEGILATQDDRQRILLDPRTGTTCHSETVAVSQPIPVEGIVAPTFSPETHTFTYTVQDITVQAYHADRTLWLEIHRQGTLLLKEPLETQMTALNPEPFFVFQGLIVAVRDRKELVVIG